MATVPQLYWPLDPALVSEWPGPRDGGSWWHYGTDFAVPVNTALRACFDGVIAFAGGDGASGVMNGVVANGQGLTVDIVRSDGLRARYGHMNRIDVRVGQRVTHGDYIGLSGNTGYTTGPHCHWELRWDNLWSGGAWVDPRSLNPIELTTGAHAATKSWEDDLKAFGGSTTKKVDQVIKPNKLTHVITADPTNVTIASGPGDVVGLNATVRMKGKKGKRVEVTLIVEEGDDKRVKTLGQQRTMFDTLGYASLEVSGSTPLKAGQKIRTVIQTEASAGNTTVVDYYWNGYARPGN